MRLVLRLALGGVILSSQANAGTVEQAAIFADPQMQVKDGQIQGCGFRLKSFPKGMESLKSFVVLDASFNLYSSGAVLLKGGAVQFAVKAGSPSDMKNRPIESFWIKLPATKPTAARGGKVINAETPGYLLYGESVDSVSKLFAGVFEGQSVTLGMRIKGESIDRIHAGTLQITPEDRQQGVQCLGDLMRQMEQEAAPKSPEPGK